MGNITVSNIDLLVSVIMPVYNGEKYLNEAIDSILTQSYQDFEFIILNDGSTDKTEEIILSYSDPRIVYIKNEQNLHITKTLNKGVALAKGKYIARMDADDVAVTSRLEEQFNFLENNSEISLVGSYYKTIELNSVVIKKPTIHLEIVADLMFACPFGHPTIMFKKESLEKYGLNYPNINHAEDYGLYVKCLPYINMANIPKVLLKYRVHNEQVCMKYKQSQIESSIKIYYLFASWLLGRELTVTEKKLHYSLYLSKELNREQFKQLLNWCDLVFFSLKDKNIPTANFQNLLWIVFSKSVISNGLLYYKDYYLAACWPGFSLKKVRSLIKLILKRMAFLLLNSGIKSE